MFAVFYPILGFSVAREPSVFTTVIVIVMTFGLQGVDNNLGFVLSKVNDAENARPFKFDCNAFRAFLKG